MQSFANSREAVPNLDEYHATLEHSIKRWGKPKLNHYQNQGFKACLESERCPRSSSNEQSKVGSPRGGKIIYAAKERWIAKAMFVFVR